jgi:hypothetical protein
MVANFKSFPSAGFHRLKSEISRFAKLMIGGIMAIPLMAESTRAQEPGISMKIDLVAWGDDINGLSLKPGQSNATITAKAFRYSDAVAYTGPALMEIYKTSSSGKQETIAQSTAEDKDHEMSPLMPEVDKNARAAGQKSPLAQELEKRRQKDPTLVALAELPAGSRHATVLLAPAEAGTFIAYVINDDPSKLPLGQIRIHNLSPLPIAMRLNGSPPKEIKAREALITPAKDQQIIYELAYKLGEEWKFQESNIQPVAANEQTQMIILRSDNRFFLSTDGATGGFLQTVTLRRGLR